MPKAIIVHTEKKELLYERAAGCLLTTIGVQLQRDHKILILLSGGSAVNIYKDITKFIDESDLGFSFLVFTQIDERFQPDQELRIKNYELGKTEDTPGVTRRIYPVRGSPGVEESENRLKVVENINAYQIEKTGLWKVCKERNIPYFKISQDGTLEESAEQYNMTIEKLFQVYTYKIAILGIGEDGHTAGLLPGYQNDWDIDKLVVGYKNDGQFPLRISLTSKAFKQVDQAIVVASGDNKMGVIRNLLNDNFNPDLDSFPVSIINSIPMVNLFYDKIVV